MVRCRPGSVAGVAAALFTALVGIAAAQEPPKQPAGEIPELPALDDLSETVDRPLFMPTRRPPKPIVAPVVEAAPVAVPPEEAPADLTGIVNGPDVHYAILTNRSTKEVHHLRKGEKIDEWSLLEIGPQYVVLRRGPGRLRLELFEEKEPGSRNREPGGDDDNEVRRPRPPVGQQLIRRPPNTQPRFVPRPQPVRRQRARQFPNRPARTRRDH